MGVESRPRDFRDNFLAMVLPRHPLAQGGSEPVRHKCPECPLFEPRPFCRVCNGVGDVTLETLAVYQMEQERRMLP
jgi:hypothetical protein